MGYGFFGFDRVSYITVNGKNYNERQNRRRIRKIREQNYGEVIPGVPQIEFERICIETAKLFKPIINVSIDGSSVTCLVKPRILWNWSFHLDFRDSGKSTWSKGSGRSNIAEQYVHRVVLRVEQYRNANTKDWMNATCPSCSGRMIRRTVYDKWYCTNCGLTLSEDAFERDNKITLWRCFKCGSYLNTQRGFSEKAGTFKCENCGATNSISLGKQSAERKVSSIVNFCPNCGAHVSSQRGKYCTHCGMRL